MASSNQQSVRFWTDDGFEVVLADDYDALEEQLEAAQYNKAVSGWGAAERASRAADENFRRVKELEEQLEAYRKALDEIAHWPGSWSGETAIMLRDHARVALDSNPAKERHE